jgi:ketosteroid isomerase-like protein
MSTEPTANPQALEQFLHEYHEGMDEFMRGSCERVKPLFSRAADVTLGNPFGPFVKGWDQVVDAMQRAALNYRDGEAVGFDTIATVVTAELAFVVEVERLRSKVGGQSESSDLALRVTTIMRLEHGTWRIVHRHADPVTTARPPESVLPT